ncbi:MAG: pilus assembly protein TadG-related protein [Planctomycetota bacterium]
MSSLIQCAVRRTRKNQRKGSAIVLSVFLVAAILMIAAIAIDYGHINVSRTEVKRTADAAAMASCWELFDSIAERRSFSSSESDIRSSGATIASANLVSATPTSLNLQSDIEIGLYDLEDPGNLQQLSQDEFNAVRVHVRRDAASGASIPLFLGSITGRNEQSMQAFSTAAMFKSIGGFYTPPKAGETLDILPIALDLETWEAVVAKQTGDSLQYSGGQITGGSDGYCECNLYPQGTGSPGNRGTVDIGGRNNSTKDLSRQIIHGISQQDLADLGKPLEFDGNHELELNGDTGISAGIKDELAAIIGQKRIIPIFTKVKGNGNNAMYTIVRWEGIRILGVKLTGPMKKKHLTIQPAPMVARYSRYERESYEESEFLYTPVMLVE